MGCLQSYFRKAHSTGLSPSPSAAAAADKKDSSGTPPGSNGHAESGSPPPRPPPKKSQGEKKSEPIPPALPPKRSSKRSSGSQGKEPAVEGATKVEERNGVGGNAATPEDSTGRGTGDSADGAGKTDTSSSGRGSAGVTPNLASPPAEGNTPSSGREEQISTTPTDVVISPSTNVQTVTMTTTEEAVKGDLLTQNETPTLDATEMPTPSDKRTESSSSGAMYSMKQDEESIEMSPLKKDDKKSSPLGEIKDERPNSTPVVVEVLDKVSPSPPCSVVISPPEDSSGGSEQSLEETTPRESPSEEKESAAEEKEGGASGSEADSAQNSTPAPMGIPLEETPKPEIEQVVQTSQDRPTSVTSEKEVEQVVGTSADRPISVRSEKEIVQVVPTSKDRPNSVTSEKETESMSVVSGSVTMDSAIVEDKESSSEAVTQSADEQRRPVGEAITSVTSHSKGRDSGLSDEGKSAYSPETTLVSQIEAGSSPEEATNVPEAAIDVRQEVNKTQAQTDEAGSPISESVGGKTSPAVSLDECGNIVLKNRFSSAVEEGEKEIARGEEADGETKEKSFGFGDSASLDTVVHVKTEGSTELPSSFSQEKVEQVSQETPLSMHEENLTTVTEEMPVKVPEEKPSSPPAGRPVSVSEDIPVSPPAEKSVSASEDRPLTTPSEKPVSVSDEKPISPSSERPVSVSEDRPVSPPAEKPASVSEDRSLTTLSERPVSVSENKSVSPPSKRPVSMREDKPVSPPAENPASVSEDRPLTTPSERSVSATEKKPVSLPAERSASLSKDRPISVTEEEVASVLLDQTIINTQETSEVTRQKTTSSPAKASRPASKDQKEAPASPVQDSEQESEFPPPPELSEEGEPRSPIEDESAFRTHSSSFELVEILNLGGSLEEDEEGGGGEKVYREGRGLVKRAPTPVNTDWPPSQEEEDEERESISPEATATPSVTSESKPSPEEEGAAKLPKDSSSGSLKGSTDAAGTSAEAVYDVPKASEENVPKESTPAASPTKDSGVQNDVTTQKETDDVVIQKSVSQAAHEPIDSEQGKVEVREDQKKSMPSREDEVKTSVEENEKVAEGAKLDDQVPLTECVVTNDGPPPEVQCIETSTSASMVQFEEPRQDEVKDDAKDVDETVDVERERARSVAEERKEVEEVGRKEIEQVVKMAVEEAERRDRASKMEGEEDDTIAVETSTEEETKNTEEAIEANKSPKESVAETEEVKEDKEKDAENDVESKESTGSIEEEKKESPKKHEWNVDDSTKKEGGDDILERNEETKTNEGETKQPLSPKDLKTNLLESAADAVEASIDGAMDAAATKIQSSYRDYKTRMTAGTKEEAAPEKVAALGIGP